MFRLPTIFVLSGMALCACETAPNGATYKMVNSDPQGATVSFTDGTECTTPCRLTITGPVRMTVARIGYAPAILDVDRRTASPINIKMAPVGRSTDVEQVALPDL